MMTTRLAVTGGVVLVSAADKVSLASF